MPLPDETNLTSDASYGLLGLKPETIAAVPLATRDDMRGFGQDYVLGFVGKRAIRPVTGWDKALERAAVVHAMRGAIEHRGYRPQGTDATAIANLIKETNEWLLLVSKGEVEPYFTDSTPALDEMGTLAGSSATSDAWARTGSCFRRCGCR